MISQRVATLLSLSLLAFSVRADDPFKAAATSADLAATYATDAAYAADPYAAYYASLAAADPQTATAIDRQFFLDNDMLAVAIGVVAVGTILGGGAAVAASAAARNDLQNSININKDGINAACSALSSIATGTTLTTATATNAPTVATLYPFINNLNTAVEAIRTAASSQSTNCNTT